MFARGTSGNKAGRPPGTRNSKWSRDIDKVFEDYNPLARLKMHSLSSEATLAEKIDCDKTLAKYFAPTLRAIDHSGEVTLVHTHEGALKQMIQELDNLDLQR